MAGFPKPPPRGAPDARKIRGQSMIRPQPGRPELLNERVGPRRKVLVEQTSHLRLPMSFDGVGLVWPYFIGILTPAVITPSGGFGQQRHAQGGRQLAVPRGGPGGSEFAIRG